MGRAGRHAHPHAGRRSASAAGLGKLLAAPLLCLACAGGSGELPSLAGHRVLLLTIDTLRWDRLGAYGDALAATPHLDRLAREGVRFERVTAPVPLTLPSHASLLTGRYPHTLGVRINGAYRLGEQEVTLAELLRPAGYRTGATVAAYPLMGKFGLAQGFDHYDDTLHSDGLFRFFSEIRADEVVTRFLRWLDGVGSAPFFGWLHFYDPHQPYAPPEAEAARFPDDPYRGEIAFVDAQVGRLLAELEARGLLAETLVVVTSDHGEAFGEHVEEGHGIFCYEETLRVPLILRSPRLPAGRVVAPRVHLVDLLPSLLELLGLEPETTSDGRSFARRLSEDGTSEGRPLYFESMLGRDGKGWAPLSGVIADEHKYIRLPQPELYDLSQDPGERRNLFDHRRAEAQRLEDELRSLLAGREGSDSASRRTLTAEDRRQLRALGYLDPSGGPGAAGSGLDPKVGISIDRRLRRAEREAEAGRPAAAEAILRAVAEEHPQLDMPEIYYTRHDIHAARGEVEAAVAAYRQGLAVFPHLEQMRFQLATYLQRQGRSEEAAAMARALLAQNPTYSQAHTLLGMISEGLGDAEGARRHFAAALRLEPRNALLRQRLADQLARSGELAEALSLYEKLLDGGLLDDDPQGLFKAALLYARSGQLDRAEPLFRRGLKLQPAGVHYLTLGFLLAQAGKLGDAAEAVETALAQHADELTPEQVAAAQQALRSWRPSS